MGKRQLIGYFEVNPAKGSGVIEIPKKFPFWGGEGFRAKKNFCFVFRGPNGSCLPILKSISPKKRTHRQTDTQTFYYFKR